MALDTDDVRALATAITDVANPASTRGKPWKGYGGEPTVVELRCNLTFVGEDGIPVRHEVKGGPKEEKTYPRVVMPLEKAQKFAKMKLGRIIGPVKPVNLKGADASK